MRFDNEQMQQLSDMMREVATDVATNIVVKEIQASEKRVISAVTSMVGTMVEDNILPQFQELRDDISEIRSDIRELREDVADICGDMTHLRGDIAGLKSARWRLA